MIKLANTLLITLTGSLIFTTNVKAERYGTRAHRNALQAITIGNSTSIPLCDTRGCPTGNNTGIQLILETRREFEMMHPEIEVINQHETYETSSGIYSTLWLEHRKKK